MTAGQNVTMAAHDLPLNMTVPGTVMLRTNQLHRNDLAACRQHDAHDLPLNMTVPGTVMLRTTSFTATISLPAASMMPTTGLHGPGYGRCRGYSANR